MKRRIVFPTLVIMVIGMTATSLVLFLRLHSSSQAQPQVFYLARTPHSAYKYDLCVEAFAYLQSSPDESHKTDYTFHDPFRNANDTIIPLLSNLNMADDTVSFKVTIIIGQTRTFSETINHVTALDGISVMLPDKENRLQRSSEPQFIVSSLAVSLSSGGTLAVLDFTCPQQWKWRTV